MITLKNLSKSFDKKVLNGLNTNFQTGTINCIAGKNGAGKTTLLNILSSIIMPSEGEVLYQGTNVHSNTELRKNIFYVAVSPFFYEKLSAKDNLELIASFYDKRVSNQEVEEVARKVGLELQDLKKSVYSFSSGMKQKLNFAAMLLVCPPVLLLDEPFNALDTKTQTDFLQILKSLASEGHTIIFTSHLVDTIYHLSQYIYILKGGTISNTEKIASFTSEEDLNSWINATIY